MNMRGSTMVNWALLVLGTILLGQCQLTAGGQEVETVEAAGKLGEPITLSCWLRDKQHLDYCSFDLLGFPEIVFMDGKNAMLSNSEFDFRIESMEKGYCNATIKLLSEKHRRLARCTVRELKSDVKRSAAVNIKMYSPVSLEIDVRNELNLKAGNALIASCNGGDSYPEAELDITFDGAQKLMKGKGEHSRNLPLDGDYMLSSKDHGRQLRCSARQLDRENKEIFPTKTIYKTLHVNFAPAWTDPEQITMKKTVVSLLDYFCGNRPAEISVNFASNPGPTKVTWFVQGDYFMAGETKKNISIAIKELKEKATYKSTLLINNLSRQFDDELVEIKVESAMGSITRLFQIYVKKTCDEEDSTSKNQKLFNCLEQCMAP